MVLDMKDFCGDDDEVVGVAWWNIFENWRKKVCGTVNLFDSVKGET